VHAELLRNSDGFDYHEALQTCLGTLQGTQRKVLDMFYGRILAGADWRGAAHVGGWREIFLRRVRAALRKCVLGRLGVADQQIDGLSGAGPALEAGSGGRGGWHEPRQP